LAIEKMKKMEELAKEEVKELKINTSGGIAKLAFKMVKEGSDAETLIHYYNITATEVAQALEIP
jgi:hypothetical protein